MMVVGRQDVRDATSLLAAPRSGPSPSPTPVAHSGSHAWILLFCPYFTEYHFDARFIIDSASLGSQINDGRCQLAAFMLAAGCRDLPKPCATRAPLPVAPAHALDLEQTVCIGGMVQGKRYFEANERK